MVLMMQITTFFHSVKELVFLIFDRGAGTLLWAVMVGSTGPLCTVGKQASWFPQSNAAWNVRLT
jgi:hypothetical protein